MKSSILLNSYCYCQDLPRGANISLQQKGFDKKAWKEATKELNYQEQKKRRQNDDLYEAPEKKTTKSLNINQQALLMILFAIIIIVVIILLLRKRLFFKNSKVKVRKDNVTIEEIEENLEESDLEYFLDQALSKKQYRLALRILYLIIIKTLSVKNLISWEKDKTNGYYVSEMYNKPNFRLFKEVTNTFEEVWYGDVQLEERQYFQKSERFKELLKAIRKGI